MDVLPDEQETLIQETAREFFAAESTPALVRAAEKDPGQYSAALWKKIADLGWLGISLPELLVTPQAKAKANTGKQQADALSSLMGEIAGRATTHRGGMVQLGALPHAQED